jgi:hypothetical protein
VQPGGVGFGKWLMAAGVMTVGIGILQAYNMHAAWLAVIVILLAIFLRYPAVWSQVREIFGLRPTGGGGGAVH